MPDATDRQLLLRLPLQGIDAAQVGHELGGRFGASLGHGTARLGLLQDLGGVSCVYFLADTAGDQFAQRGVQPAGDLVAGPAQIAVPLGPYLQHRRVNHAIHMAAITQIRHSHSDGRAYYDKKLAEGKTHKEALRSLKRRISNAIYRCLLADARQAAAAACTKGSGGQPGNDSDSGAAGSHPERRLFGQATPEPSPTLRPATPARRSMPPKHPASKKTRRSR